MVMSIATGHATVLGSLKALSVTTAIGVPFIRAKLRSGTSEASAG